MYWPRDVHICADGRSHLEEVRGFPCHLGERRVVADDRVESATYQIPACLGIAGTSAPRALIRRVSTTMMRELGKLPASRSLGIHA